MHIIDVNNNSEVSISNSDEITISHNSVSSDDKRSCRFCHLNDEETNASPEYGEWIHPCKCSGTMKWVHSLCMESWLEVAPYQQRRRCILCGYFYQSSWHIKSLNRWRFPQFNLTLWDGFGISFDFIHTYYALECVKNLVQNKAKSLLRSCLLLGVWKMLVANNRRLGFYRQLLEIAIGTFLVTSVRNAI